MLKSNWQEVYELGYSIVIQSPTKFDSFIVEDMTRNAYLSGIISRFAFDENELTLYDAHNINMIRFTITEGVDCKEVYVEISKN